MTEVKYIDAGSKAKWVLATFLISMLVIGSYFYFKLSDIVVPKNAPIEVLQSITKEYQSLTRQVTVVNLLLAIGLSPYFIRLGMRTMKYKEYPLRILRWFFVRRLFPERWPWLVQPDVSYAES